MMTCIVSTTAAMQKTPQISIVILGYRSGEFIRTLYQRTVDVMVKYGLDYEIILVGNYLKDSDDVTPDIIREIASSHEKTKVITQEKPTPKHAMGWDVKCGLKAATGDILAFMDGDGQVPPEDLPALFYKLKKENLDLCKAKRISRGDGLYRKFISFLFNRFMNILFPQIKTGDINAKPKLFTRSAYTQLQLESNDWFIDPEIMIKALRYRFKIGEVETVFAEYNEQESSVSFKTNIEYFFNALWWRIKEFRFLFTKID